MGWYDGTVEKITKSTPTDTEYEIEFTDGEVETWNQESFTWYCLDAIIPIGKNKNKCCCKSDKDDDKKYKTSAQLQKLAKNHFRQIEDEVDIYYTEDKEEEEEEEEKEKEKRERKRRL
eukprot:7795400-Ditylum_brightwellii.AAC.2